MSDKFDEKTLKEAHKHSFLNKEELLKSEICGCFDCLRIFKPEEIKHWHFESKKRSGQKGYTAFCPYSGFDTILGSASGYPITPEFLRAMQVRWCPTEEQIASGEGKVITFSSLAELEKIFKDSDDQQ